MKKLLTLILWLCSVVIMAQHEHSLLDSLYYRGEIQTIISCGSHTPLWLNANRYGLSSLKRANGYLRGAVERPLSIDSLRRWGIGYGLDMALATGFTSTLVVQQAYGEVRWLKGILTIGAKEQPMELKNSELSTGSQTLGINARPVPEVRLSLPNYWTIPYTKKWLAIKGHVAYGMYTDGNWQKDFTHRQSRYIEHALHHTKAGYLRIGPKNITVELGLEMACQFGGTSYLPNNGSEEVYKNAHNLKAFYHAMIPMGNDVTDGGWNNAEGNHLGSWVARVNLDYKTFNLGIYADHFFEDNSSMLHISYDGWGSGDEAWSKKDNRYFVHSFKDWLLGVELKLKQVTWLNDIVIEYMYTKYQGGPIYHDHTKAISEHICGRDNFYNHNLQTGWQHWGQVMGNPLYRSPSYNEDGKVMVKNNRFKAWHLGLSGDPMNRLHYRLLITWQRSSGTYDELLRDPQETLNMMGEATCQLQKGWLLKGAVAFDSGKVYGNNVGCQLTIVKTGIFNLRRK